MGEAYAWRLHRRFWLKVEGEHLPKALGSSQIWEAVIIITKATTEEV